MPASLTLENVLVNLMMSVIGVILRIDIMTLDVILIHFL